MIVNSIGPTQNGCFEPTYGPGDRLTAKGSVRYQRGPGPDHTREAWLDLETELRVDGGRAGTASVGSVRLVDAPPHLTHGGSVVANLEIESVNPAANDAGIESVSAKLISIVPSTGSFRIPTRSSDG